jgi:hypothetical protein
MSEIRVQQTNEKIGYPEGKIFWEPLKGWTSQLMKNLYKQGYRACKSGSAHILKDKQGTEVCKGYSWEGLLLEAALIMR